MNKIKTIIGQTGIYYLLVGILCAIASCGEVDSSILRAVPDEAGIIIKTSHLKELTESLNNGNTMWEQIKSSAMMKEANSSLSTLNDILRTNNSIRNVLQDKEITMSFHLEGKEKIRVLFAAQLEKKEVERLLVGITAIVDEKQLSSGRYTHDNTQVYVLTPKDNKQNIILTFSYVRGVFVCSTSKLITERSVRHINSNNSIGNNESLRQLLSTEGKNAQAVLIVNYKHLRELIATDFAVSTKKVAQQGEWGIMDINLENHYITIAGYTNSKDSEGQYLKMLEKQAPVPNDFVKYLPSKTTSFISLGIKDMNEFIICYNNLLKERDGYVNHQNANSSIKKAYNIDLDEQLRKLFVNRITQFSCDYNMAGRERDKYIIAELENHEEMETFVSDICSQHAKSHGLSESKIKTNIKTVADKSYTAYAWPFKKIFNSYFSDLFDNEVSYVTIYQDKAIFAQSPSSISEYISCMEKKKVLSENSNFAEFKKLVTPKSNLYIYTDIAYCKQEIKNMLSKANATQWNNNFQFFKDFRSLAIQYSYNSDNIYYTCGALMYNPVLESDRYTSWITPTDTTITMKPQIVKNHNNKNTEILVQDEGNKIYLIDKEGNILLKKQIAEPIMGSVTQIDMYQNGKLQFLFATENFIHLIDRNGNYADRFPLKLPASLSAEISVFDYESNGTYRIFAPCSDRKLYLYTKEGLPLDTWTPVVTTESIITPIQHFRVCDNDYLVCSDNLKTYIFNRRGELRINVTNNFPKAKNSLFYVENSNDIETARFITTNSSGEVEYISMNGSCKSKKFKNYSADHYFLLKDLDGDGKNDYIYTDDKQLEAYTENGTLIMAHYNDGKIGKPLYFKFSDTDIRIGVTCRNNSKIYLLNNKGKLCQGFPLMGMSDFSITRLNNPDKFSLITGGNENYLYNYLIQ